MSMSLPYMHCEELDDVLVVQLPQDRDLELQGAHQLVAHLGSRYDLDGHRLLGRPVVALVHLRKGACAEFHALYQHVRAELLGRHARPGFVVARRCGSCC